MICAALTDFGQASLPLSLFAARNCLGGNGKAPWFILSYAAPNHSPETKGGSNPPAVIAVARLPVTILINKTNILIALV